MWKIWPFKRREPKVTYVLLDIANRRRIAEKKPVLNRFDAQRAVSSSYDVPGFDVVDFLVGYETGIPWNLSAGGMIGAALHDSTERRVSADYKYDPDTNQMQRVEPMVPRFSDEDRRQPVITPADPFEYMQRLREDEIRMQHEIKEREYEQRGDVTPAEIVTERFAERESVYNTPSSTPVTDSYSSRSRDEDSYTPSTSSYSSSDRDDSYSSSSSSSYDSSSSFSSSDSGGGGSSE